MTVANNRSLSTDGIITKHLFRKTMITMLFAELAGGVTAIIDGISIRSIRRRTSESGWF